MQRIHRLIALALLVAGTLLAGVSTRNPVSAQDSHPHKRRMPATLAAGPNAVSQDFGDVAVLVDNGLMVTRRNLFDLAGTTVRFAPAGDHRYTVSSAPGAPESAFGPALTFGFPGATEFPGDDDTQEVAFPAGFPFFGTTYSSVWVNTDGNITFGAPDFASDKRDKARHVLGPPRVSAFLHDWNPNNLFNPAGSGSIHAVVKTNPDRLLVTWSGVADFEGGVSSTFQLALYSSGVAEVTIVNIDAPSIYGVVGIAQGSGQGPLEIVDFTTPASLQTLAAGAIMEAFAEFTRVDNLRVAREFYKTHPDQFDFLAIMTDFPADFIFHPESGSNQTHGIGQWINPADGSYDPLFNIYDRSAEYGSAGELESIAFLNNVHLLPSNAAHLVSPPIEPYTSSSNIMTWFDAFGGRVSFDGQALAQIRSFGTLPEDDGEWSRYFAHGGSFSLGLNSPMFILAHEVGHRWLSRLRFVHPTKGTGFDSYDLLGREANHWSYFLNTALPLSQFDGAPRSSVMEGNVILDLGPLANYNGTPTNLAPGERVFLTPTDQLVDGFSTLDQHLMGLRRASDVPPFFYVDEPRSLLTGQSLDGFPPVDTSVTMRGWQPAGGIVFAGKRVDLTMKNLRDFEAIREGKDNPRGRRFWGPKGNLTVRYFSDTRRVDPNGDAKVILSEEDRELGDEADSIDASGKPVDVKTMAFILVVQAGDPSAHTSAISQVDTFRQVWQAYANGPATGGRGKFDTRLNPAIH